MLPVAEQAMCIEGMIDAAERKCIAVLPSIPSEDHTSLCSFFSFGSSPCPLQGKAQELRRMDHANDGSRSRRSLHETLQLQGLGCTRIRCELRPPDPPRVTPAYIISSSSTDAMRLAWRACRRSFPQDGSQECP